MSFLKRLFGLKSADNVQKVQPAPICPFVVGGTTTLVKDTLDYEFTEIQKTEWGWKASGIATVRLPRGAINKVIKEIVSSKYGSVEGYNIHFEVDGQQRVIYLGSEYNFETEMKNRIGYNLYVRMDVKEVRV
jgi:hypothetical protein